MMEKISIIKDEIPVFTCPECGKNLFEVGVTEHTNGADVTVVMVFEDGKSNDSDHVIDARREQYIECNECHASIDMDSDHLLSVFEGRRTQDEVKIECGINAKPTLNCPHCNLDMFKDGIIECNYGGLAKCTVTFEEDIPDWTETIIENPKQSYTQCVHCNKTIRVPIQWFIDLRNADCTLENIIENCGPICTW